MTLDAENVEVVGVRTLSLW